MADQQVIGTARTTRRSRSGRLTCARLVTALKRIRGRIQDRDPHGQAHGLRLSVSYGLYASFDGLRCQDRPFDRRLFANHLQMVEHLAQIYPVQQAASPAALPRGSVEERVAQLYSQCWANYDDAMFRQTVDLFEERLRLNRVDPAFVRGAECLDAGCGSGRFTLAMAALGARRAIGIDISERAIREAAQRRRRLGFGRTVRFQRGSVIDMPKGWTNTFDVVCSSGVVHHTRDPVKGLQEVFRVLRPGGEAYLFVYGAGGLFWEVVDVARSLLASVPLALTHAWLKSLGVPAGKTFNYLDHWYTPIQERVTRRAFERRLLDCGFRILQWMPRGKVYESSERRVRFPEERDLLGDGELRYLVEKPAR